MSGNAFKRVLAIGSAMAVLVLAAAFGAGTANAGIAEFTAGLEAGGYAYQVAGPTVSYPSFKVAARSITADKSGARATVELFEYASEAQLREDWLAVNGERPQPRLETTAFDGRVLYWNGSSILAVDFRPPNDAGTAKTVGDIFLGRVGTGGPLTSGGATTGGDQASAPLTPPRTGDGDLLAVAAGPGAPFWPKIAILALALGLLALSLVGQCRRDAARAR